MITLYTIFYNEAVILPFFLNHYTKFVDKFVFYNNESTDNSVNIIKNFDLKDYEIITYSTNNEIRDDIYLDIKCNCWKDSKSDFVIVCDIDEFLYHKDILSVLDNNCPFYFTEGYDMVSNEIPTDTTKQIYDIINIGVKNTNYSKIVMFNPNLIGNINYQPGCHVAFPTNKVNERISGCSIGLKILHYKMLSLNYVIKKHEEYGKRLSEINLRYRWGIEYKSGAESITEYFNKNINEAKIII